VFENDSMTNIAHQLGYFETVASWRLLPTIRERIESVTLDQIAAVATERLKPTNRTVGWFEPSPVSA
jgi:predicted Zn-dependent peptidase